MSVARRPGAGSVGVGPVCQLPVCEQLLARSNSRLLVDVQVASTSTLKPGSSGSNCWHSAWAPQSSGVGMGRATVAQALAARDAGAFGASIVPRQVLAPQRHSKRFFNAGV